MKLQDLHEYSGHASTGESYIEYLKDKGYNVPLGKGKKGFNFISFHPTKVEKTFKTLADAKAHAPEDHGKYWIIMDHSNGSVAKVPDWWLHDHHMSWQYKGQH